jgi:hypothetical protein
MLTCHPNTTWFQGLSTLFCSKDLLPMSNMSLEEQINATTRAVLVIFIIILIFDLKCSIAFLLVSLIFIIILYYLQRNLMEKIKTESFQLGNNQNITQAPHTQTPTQAPTPDPEDNSMNPKYQVPIKPKINYIYANCNYEDQPKLKNMFCDDQVNVFTTVSMNQKLAGKPNPKTLIPPVSVTPAFDPSWRATNLTKEFKGNNNREPVHDLYQSGYMSKEDIQVGNQYESYRPNNSTYSSNSRKTNYSNRTEFDNMDDNSFHHRNMNTQTIQPGVYFKNEVMEPVSTNIGITETKRGINPQTEIKDNGDIYYNEYNNNARFKKMEQPPVGPQDIYDPRFTGYGTSYRSYFDDFIGQPKFYYDDIDAMRMPNYLVRSKIDHLEFADQYGPMADNYENDSENMREMVNQSFLDNAISFRTDLQERLMRKRNSEMAYIRQFPKQTGGQRMMGGLGFRG